ncbi:MAG: AI-2E family transporter [Deferrisomatales bacterium]|nr:AI-2E family transporter [Deferrisomatales bacterium]
MGSTGDGKIRDDAVLWGALALGLAGALWLVARLHTVFVPLLLAWFLAYALDPVIDRLEARRIPRPAGIALLFAAVLAVLAALAFLVVPTVARELRQAASALPAYAAQAQEVWLPRVEALLGRPLPAGTGELLREGAGALQEHLPGLAPRAAAVVGRAFASAWSLAAAILGLALVPVFAFYLLVEIKGLGARVVGALPAGARPAARRILERSDAVLGAFVRGQLTVCAVLGLVYSLGLSLTGIDMPWAVGLLSGALLVVPYLGTAVGVALGSLLALLKFQDLAHLLAVWGVFAAGQLLESFLLTPRLVGSRVGLHPLAVMVAVVAGGELFGFVGILLAVPAAAVLRVGLADAYAAYRTTRFYRGAP